MNYNIWRFPGNNHTDEKGLNTADMETFMKDPMSSLAREICQNSIDAKRENCQNAIVEFELFSINKNEIPGYERLKEEIYSCYDYRRNPDDKASLKKMYEAINKDKIYCLRISDKNTTGLKDAFKDDESSTFYLLTHGSGLTSKSGESGGSKGVGKFACFVASAFKTVFYSSVNEAGEEGFLGISKLCSTISKEDPTDKTQGIGYYSSDPRNLPIPGQLHLQPGYARNEPGTDIYILGFDESDDWKKKIITMILDSFMVAIVFGELTIKLDTMEINKDNVGALIDSGYITNNKKNIKAQYDLLTGNDVYRETLTFPEIGDVKILLKPYKREEADEGTKQCVMVRYPHMKIKTMKKVSSVPCSAMCIIEQGPFNKSLIKIENPQHTDWELNRLKGALKVEMSNRLKTLEDGILNYIADTLSLGMEEESDIEGAGDYLPSANNGDFGEQKTIITEIPIVVPKRRAKIKDTNPVAEANDGSEADVVDIGDFDDNGDDTHMPSGHNEGHSGDVHTTEETSGHTTEGDKEILRSEPLKGMKYIPFMPNKESGEQIISFTSLYNTENAELHLAYRDDSSGKYVTEILEATINGVSAKVENGVIKNIKMNFGQNYIVKTKTNLRDYYRIEVTMYENKK